MKKIIFLSLAGTLLLTSCFGKNVDDTANDRAVIVDCYKEVSTALDSNKTNSLTKNSLDLPSTVYEKTDDSYNVNATKQMIYFLSLAYENENMPVGAVTSHITCDAKDESGIVIQENDLMIKSILDRDNNKVLCEVYGTTKEVSEDANHAFIVCEVNYDFSSNKVNSFDLYIEDKGENAYLDFFLQKYENNTLYDYKEYTEPYDTEIKEYYNTNYWTNFNATFETAVEAGDFSDEYNESLKL